jgi:hypothetical protein
MCLCENTLLNYRCPFTKPCMWRCKEGICHWFYVFGHACEEANVQ